MTPDVRLAYDEATVVLLRATSTREVLERVEDEEAAGYPAYDAVGRLRWGERLCVCGSVFVAHVFSPWQKCCSTRCAQRERDYRHRVKSGGVSWKKVRLAVIAEGVRARKMEMRELTA
jgi:hypothetical protein